MVLDDMISRTWPQLLHFIPVLDVGSLPLHWCSAWTASNLEKTPSESMEVVIRVEPCGDSVVRGPEDAIHGHSPIGRTADRIRKAISWRAFNFDSPTRRLSP